MVQRQAIFEQMPGSSTSKVSTAWAAMKCVRRRTAEAGSSLNSTRVAEGAAAPRPRLLTATATITVSSRRLHEAETTRSGSSTGVADSGDDDVHAAARAAKTSKNRVA